MKAVVFTLGCKVNECESDSLITGLINKGYQVSDKLEKADLYIVNTCAVTSEAEKKSRQMSARINKINPNARVIFTGCAVQKDYTPFITKQNTSLVVGNANKQQILDLIDEEGVKIADLACEFEELLPVSTLKERAFIKVQDGCNNFCSYCIVPYLRGRSRSRNPESVKEEILKLNPKEAVITGINLSAYNYNGVTLSGLMETLKDVDCRIRLGSLEVGVITKEFLTSLKGLKNFAPHFHLSLQSGSNNVLEKMNRKYTKEEYALKVDLIREYFADAGITTDIIVGFPTESEQDFLDTLWLTDRVKFSDIHPFIFSARQGTVAYKLPEVPFSEKKKRSEILINKKHALKAEFIKKMLGKTFDFLYEETRDGFAVGYTENYIRCYIEDFTDTGKIQKVEIIEGYLDGAKARVIK